MLKKICSKCGHEKDTKDMGYIFLVLAVGMAVGTGNYVIAIATTLITLLIIFILNKFDPQPIQFSKNKKNQGQFST